MLGEAETRVALAEPEQQPGDEEEHRESGIERRVQLLPGVEAALRCGTAATQPADVVGVEAVELARRAQQSAPVAEQRDQHERADPADTGPRMDVLDQRPAADEHRQARQVEDQPRGEEHEEAERVHPVQRALGAREAPEVVAHRSRNPLAAAPGAAAGGGAGEEL